MSSQSHQIYKVGFVVGSPDATQVGLFMRLNLSTFMRSKVEEDSQEFVDEMEKNFRVIHDSDTEGVEFVFYQLKRWAYQWYDEWEEYRGDDAKPAIWEDSFKAFLDHFFPQKLREAKAGEFFKFESRKDKC